MAGSRRAVKTPELTESLLKALLAGKKGDILNFPKISLYN